MKKETEYYPRGTRGPGTKYRFTGIIPKPKTIDQLKAIIHPDDRKAVIDGIYTIGEIIEDHDLDPNNFETIQDLIESDQAIMERDRWKY